LNPFQWKFAVVIVLSITTLLSLNAIYHWYRLPFVAIDPLEAIPPQTAILLESGNLTNIESLHNDSFGIQNLLFAGFRTIEYPLRSQLPSLYAGVQKPKVYIGLEKISARQIGAIYVIDTRTLSDSIQMEFQSLLKDRSQSFNFEDVQYQLVNGNNDASFAFYSYRNLLLISAHPILIESAIRTLQSYRTNLLQDSNLSTLRGDNNSTENKLYLNFGLLPKFLSSFVKTEHHSVLNAVSGLTEWMRVDFPEGEGGRIRGSYAPLIKARRSANKTSLPLVDKWAEVIPDNTGFLAIQNDWQAPTTMDSIFTKFTLPWYTQEWGLALVNPGTTADRILFLRAKSLERMEHYLSKYSDRYGLLEDIDYQTYQIKKLMDADLVSPFNRLLNLGIDQVYYTIIGDFAIFAKTRLSLESLLDKHIVGQTLQNKVEFQQFAKDTGLADAGLVYISFSSMYTFLNKILKDQGKSYLQNNIKAQQSFWSGGWQANVEKQRVVFKMKIVQKQQLDQGPTLAWRLALQHAVLKAPKAFWNPQKSAYEILVQDKSYQLYLLDENGDMLWKKRLDGPIISAIYQVDYQEDGDLKYFFNTALNIYLLDNQGKPVGNYPLQLQSPATNGLCITNLKRSYAYQFFIACENGHAYGFTKDGNPLSGWNPKYNVGEISQTFHYLQQLGKDNILILNDQGELKAFDSGGHIIYRKTSTGVKPWNHMEIIKAGNQKSIMLTSGNSHINLVNGSGVVDGFSIKANEPGEILIKSISQPDQYQHFVVLNNTQITYYTYLRKKLTERFSLKLDQAPDTIFDGAVDPNMGAYFGVIDRTNKKIYLYASEGGLVAGFPLPGNAPFDIFSNRIQNQAILLSVLDKEVFAYRINLN
jgi:hypothetical protein